MESSNEVPIGRPFVRANTSSLPIFKVKSAKSAIAEEAFIETTAIFAPLDFAVSRVGSSVLVPPDPEITIYKSPSFRAGVTISPTILTLYPQ